MTAHPCHLQGDAYALRVGGWIISCCLHAGVLMLAAAFVARIGLAPSADPFRWDVAVISPTISAPSPQAPADVARPVTEKAAVRRSPPPPRAHPVLLDRPSVLPQSAAPSEAVPPPSLRPIEAPQSVPGGMERVEPNLAPTLPEPPVSPTQQTATTLTDPSAQWKTSGSEGQALPARSPATMVISDPPNRIAAIDAQPSPAPAKRTADYGWLSDTLLRRIEEFKRYPAAARLDRLEGRVVIRAVILEDGSIASIEIAKSSGHDVLDEAALDVLRRVSPLTLLRPLDKPRVTVHIPLSYSLNR